MKKLITTTILILFAINLMATVYWVSPSGTDAATGRTRAAAWQTLDKVSAEMQTGDIFRFKRASTWNDTLFITASNITLIAWGEGREPVIQYVYIDTTVTTVSFQNITVTNFIYPEPEPEPEMWPEEYSGTIYYVSADGDSGNDGLNKEEPKPLTAISTLDPGDDGAVLINSVDTLTGTITVNYSGSSGSPITYAPYGIASSKPVISGFTPVTAWTNLGGNIWESTNAVSTLPYLNIVLVNGRNTAMGRTPNDGSVYTASAVVDDVSVTSASLTGTPNYTGAQVVMRKEAFAWQVANVTSQSTSTINFTDIEDNYYTAKVGMGFFLQAHESTLDAQNEWYYNPSTKKLRIFSTSEPTDVKVSDTELLVNNDAKNYITFKNIEFNGSNARLIHAKNSTAFTVEGCTFKNAGHEALVLQSITGGLVNNNTFSNNNFGAVFNWIGTASTNMVITNNVIDSTFMIVGVGRLYPPGAIHTNCNNVLVQYNTVTNSGKEGIKFQGTHSEIRNNFVNNSILKSSDGGGIYTYNDSGVDALVDGNIVLNSLGYPLGEVNNYIGARGIYLDANSQYTTVSNNTVYNCYDGINVASGSHDNIVEGNLTFDNYHAGFYCYNLTEASGSFTANTITGNKFIAKASTQNTAFYRTAHTTGDDILNFFTTSNTNIFARPLNENTTIARLIGATTVNLSLAEWQAYSSKDAGSLVSSKLASTVNDILFYYNETKVAKVVTLEPGNWVEVDGTSHTGTVTLQPFRSIVLVRNSFPAQMEATRYAASMVTPLPDSTVNFINEFVYHTKNIHAVDSLPQAFETMYIFKNETKEAALKNLVKRTGFDALEVGTTTFTQKQGIAGNGTSSYLNTQFTPSTHSNVFTQNSASMSLYSNTDGILAVNDMGSRTTSTTHRTAIACRFTGDVAIGSLNVGGTSTRANTNGTGYFVASRTASNASPIYRNGVQLGSNITDASTGLSERPIAIGGSNSAGSMTYSTRQFSYADIGRGRTASEVQQHTVFVQWLLNKL